MNSVQIMGNLTKDMEIRTTNTGRAVAVFTVAVNRSFVSVQGERREQTDFIPVVAWGRLAEAYQGMPLTKGTRVFVEGRFQTRSYETREGEKRYMTEVVANLIAPNAQSAMDSAPLPKAQPPADYSAWGGTSDDVPMDEKIPMDEKEPF